MKIIRSITAVMVFSVAPLFGGEDAVTYTIQALTGLAGDTPRFDKIYCHDKFAFSGEPTAFSFISQPYYPPSNTGEQPTDHNLISASGFAISAPLAEDGQILVIVDASKITIPKALYDGSPEGLLEYALECIRMIAALSNVNSYSVDVVAAEGNQKNFASVEERFKSHDKTKAFAHHPAEAPSK